MPRTLAENFARRFARLEYWRPLILLLPLLILVLWMPMGFGSKPVSTATLGAHSDAKNSAGHGAENTLPDNASDIEQYYVYGVVTKVVNVKPATATDFALQQEPFQKVTVILDPESRLEFLKSQTITVDNPWNENPANRIPVKPGQRVVVNVQQDLTHKGGWLYMLTDRDRTPALMILTALLILAVLMIGGPEVTKHMLLATILLIGSYKALFPAILGDTQRYQAGMLWVFLMCFMYTILGSFIYQVPGQTIRKGAFTREQSVVILGTMGGLVIMACILALMHVMAPLNGYTDENLVNLWFDHRRLDYWALMVASVLIGYQGFIFYLCWMLAQTRKEAAPLNFSDRFHIVMLRGRRLLGPMLSSLGLLFLGMNLPLLLQMQGIPGPEFINKETIASLITYALSGGLTLILTVPMIAVIAAWIYTPLKDQTEAA